MGTISVFDMFKVGVGPSSSHTLGPWRIVQRFLRELDHAAGPGGAVTRVRFHLLGSLALTGHGHATDKAIGLAMLGQEPESVEVDAIDDMLSALAARKRGRVGGRDIAFDPAADIVFEKNLRHERHANAMRCVAELDGGARFERVYFSLGGGFICAADEDESASTPARAAPPFPIRHGRDILKACQATGLEISGVVLRNETAWRPEAEVRSGLYQIWMVMRESARRGCRIEGVLPGGLDVRRRAPAFLREIVPEIQREDIGRLIHTIREARLPFEQVIRAVSCYAMAVNEENAAMGRVVTAPTNGAAGVIPAVLMYRACFGPSPITEDEVVRFMLVAGQVGALFKMNATISAAMGGCQAEIGVSSAMAAAGLCELMGASPAQCLCAAEIAMEHHLGMTCDPVGGLVQIPCIERNAMGALKAITAATIAQQTDPATARVSLDDVIEVMWETAKQMNERYKETSLGGLAVKLSVTVGLAEC
jgi:L-serine dehydratase